MSKTAMLALVKAFRWREVDAALEGNRELRAFRDERGRNWLHICCATQATGAKVKDGIRTAEVLLARGLDIDREAFTEGTWKATPLWFTIGRGRNLALAEYLLKRGCNPNHCLFAAAFRNDIPAIRLLARHGADVNQSALDETPFLGAIKTSHFAPAAVLLELGADPNYRDRRGMTALHYMLKKGSDKRHFGMLLAHGARRHRERAGRHGDRPPVAQEGSRLPPHGRAARRRPVRAFDDFRYVEEGARALYRRSGRERRVGLVLAPEGARRDDSSPRQLAKTSPWLPADSVARYGLSGSRRAR